MILASESSLVTSKGKILQIHSTALSLSVQVDCLEVAAGARSRLDLG